MVDKSLITRIGMGDESALHEPLLKRWCGGWKHPEQLSGGENSNNSLIQSNSSMINEDSVTSIALNSTLIATTGEHKVGHHCGALLNYLELSDLTAGIILLSVSLVLLCSVLVILVKVLQGLFKGHIAGIISKTVNANFPQPFSFLTGYFALVVGAIMTMLVQSSSIFTSALTPLVGIGVVRIERVYPLTLGSNIGTTVTGILAATAADPSKLEVALQIAFCHLLFNVSGILIWFPLPFMRKVPINLAKKLGNTTAEYRWFAMLYLFLMFVLLPVFVFSLSLAGRVFMLAIGVPVAALFFVIVIINWLQSSEDFSRNLPNCLQTWNFLPLFMHSLEPWDRFFRLCGRVVMKLLCCFRKTIDRRTAATNAFSTRL